METDCLGAGWRKDKIILRSKDGLTRTVLNNPDFVEFIACRLPDLNHSIDFVWRHEYVITYSPIESLEAVCEGYAELTHELEEVRKALQSLSITKAERQHLERSLKVIRDQIAERQSQAVLLLSADDRAALDDLEAILEQQSERRKEIKSQIEEYRKIMGGSGLDFEKAMRYGELMETEKQTLAKIDESIAEIKKKIQDLKKSK